MKLMFSISNLITPAHILCILTLTYSIYTMLGYVFSDQMGSGNVRMPRGSSDTDNTVTTTVSSII